MTANESMLRAALALSPDAIFMIDAGTLQYIEFNDALCTITGRSREELNRVGPLGLWTQTGGSPEALRQHYDALIAQSPTRMQHTTVMHRPDGRFEHVWMDRQALRLDGRWVILALARVRRKPTAQAAPGADAARPDQGPDTMNQLRAAVMASPHAASLIDYQGMRYLEVNALACDMLGYTRDELLEGELPLTGERTLEDLRQVYSGLVMQSPRPSTEINVFMRSDGEEARGEVTRQALLADGMWVIYVVVKLLP